MEGEENPPASEEDDSANNLVCVEYPGKVENVEKMIETLGGLENISVVAREPNRRLELRFRPGDAFSKPTCGERASNGSASFLVKVSELRNKETGERKIVPQFLGNVETDFKFMNLCDFQYLPMSRKSPDNPPEYEDIYDVIYMKKLESLDWVNQEKDAPLFLPPAAFSRMDAPQDYQFRKETMSAEETPYNIIGRTRQRRSHHAIFVTFDVEKVPDKPRAFAVNQLKLKFIDAAHQKTVNERFSEVPIWSKNTLHAVTKIPPERLKFILPSVAYYFTTGPWRNQWVRFSYDPRKHRDSALYQTLDYRVRLQGGAKHKVKAKRSYANYLLPYKAMNWSKAKTSIINREVFEDDDSRRKVNEEFEKKEEDEKLKDVYLFRSGRIPPYRQMFYQFKDLCDDEAQKLIKSSLIPEGQTCDEKSGWFTPGTDQKLRDLLTRSLNNHLAMEKRKKEDEVEASSSTIDPLGDVVSDDDEYDEDDEEDNPTLSEMKFLQPSSDEEDIKEC